MPHKDAVSEFGLTGIVDGAIQRVFVDRMFLDDDTRWIIDYKSGQPREGQDIRSFCKEQISRHQTQLLTYKTIASNIYLENIRTGLFFTSSSIFEEVSF